MKITVLGSGAMGCLYGAAWHRAGCDVRLVDVNQRHIDAINRDGLEVDLRGGAERLKIPAFRPEQITYPADLIAVFTKTFHTQQALKGMAKAIGPDTYVLSLQNGLGNDDALAKFVPQTRVMIGISTMPADLIGPGKIRSHGDGGSAIFCAFDGPSQAAISCAKQAASDLTQGGIATSCDPQIRSAVWSKAIFNAVMNPLCALTLRTPGFLAANQESRAMITSAVEEGVAAARASGVEVDGPSIHALTEMSMTDHADHEASMLQDIKAGRRTEIDGINGEIIAAAKSGGVQTPLLETFYNLVKLEEAKQREV